jgi:hypothetical protein
MAAACVSTPVQVVLLERRRAYALAGGEVNGIRDRGRLAAGYFPDFAFRGLDADRAFRVTR